MLQAEAAPVDSALVLVPQQGEALPEALPKVLEQRPINGLCMHTA